MSTTDGPERIADCIDAVDDSLSRDVLFDALSARRRRRLLRALLDANGVASRSELVDAVADAEADAGESHRRRVATSLHHCHLPKLDDVDLVDYDTSEGIVQYSGPDDVRAIVDGATEPRAE